MKGFIHIDTGDGKRKTTTAMSMALKSIEAVKEVVITQNNYNIMIPDKICIALLYKFIEIGEILKLLKAKPEDMKIVLSGYSASSEDNSNKLSFDIQIVEPIVQKKSIIKYSGDSEINHKNHSINNTIIND
ncbi:MAG: cob(I)yrinic acid a,c-diamide adenosyltransferase [Bacteroidota bacterium]